MLPMPQLIDILNLPTIIRTGMMQNSHGVTCYKGGKYNFVILYILLFGFDMKNQAAPSFSSISLSLFII